MKITVIATGFQRDSLPEIDRRNPHFPFTTPISPEIAAVPFHAPEPVTAPVEAAQEHQEEGAPMDDHEIPALMRKQRRMVQ